MVPAVATALSVVRLKEGGSLKGRVVGGGVAVMVHWSGRHSFPCTGSDADCSGCKAGRSSQWQAFFPVRVSGGGLRLVLVGARSLGMAQITDCDSLIGREVTFKRPAGRRFVELKVSCERLDVKECDVHGPVAVLFGCHAFLPRDGDDRIERAYASLMQLGAMSGDA